MSTLFAKLRGARRSLTIWANSVAGTLVVALPMLQDQAPQLQPYLPANIYQYAMGAIVAINILLRFKTSAPLEDKQ